MVPRIRNQLRNAALCATLVAAIGYFVHIVNAHYAIGSWLCWRYLGYWVEILFWGASCLSIGNLLLRCVNPPDPEQDDLFALAFPLGVFAFAMAIFLLGLLHLLNAVTFVLLPAAFILAGAGELFHAASSRWRRTERLALRDLLLLVFGLGGIGLLYFQILTPETLGHDARWYHMPLGQQYAYTGVIGPWPEGWWLGAYPQLASYLYTWAFLTPNVLLFDKYELCSHIEFLVFLGTLAGIPSLVRALAPGVRARSSWVALFLFPGIFLYDANLNGVADHIAALWAVPIALSLLRLYARWSFRYCLLWAVFVSGAALTKYMALTIVAFPVLAFSLRAFWLALSRHNRPNLSTLTVSRDFLATVVVGLVLTSIHWLKNWLWYGDPVFPALWQHLAVHPWNPDSPTGFKIFSSFLDRPKPGWQGVFDGLTATAAFSFRAYDWPCFHQKVPVFGSLFALTAVCLPFARANRRLFGGYLAALVGVFVWYMIAHYERYLQILLPWMATCVAATLILMWQTRHLLVRLLVATLVALQILWGGDIPFFPTHNIIFDSPFRVVAKFLASGFQKTPNRLRPFGESADPSALVPRDAVVLLHNQYPFGYDARFVSDLWQGRISYSRLGSPAAIHRELRSLGVTHVLWRSFTGLDWTPLAHDMAFADFAMNYLACHRSAGEMTVGLLPRAKPLKQFDDRVAAYTCGRPHASGWYTLGSLIDPAPGEPAKGPDAVLGDAHLVVQQAGFLLVNPACMPNLPGEVDALFHPPFKRGTLNMYVRRVAR